MALASLAVLMLMAITEQQAAKKVQKDYSKKKRRTIRKIFIKTDNEEMAGKEERKCRSDF